MINSAEQTKHTMNTYLGWVAGDKRALVTEAGMAAINDKMRLVQIDLIRSYWDGMDDETKARAKRTLDQIGGDDFRGLTL